MKVVGRARNLTIKRKCACCNETFIMTCTDYINNECGEIFKNSERMDDWICKDCAKYIREIK